MQTYCALPLRAVPGQYAGAALFTRATVPEPLVALLAALAGAVFGSATNWVGNVGKRDQAAAVALVELAASVKHIDKTLQRFESKFEMVQDTLQSHDTRITRLEATSHEPLA